jgi:hypothetical protein
VKSLEPKNGMWPVDQFPVCVDHPFGARLTPDEVLYYFDEPLLFTTVQAGNVYLACASDADDVANRFLVARLPSTGLAALKNDRLTVFDALDQPELWVVDQAFEGLVLSARKLPDLESVPESARPTRDVLLYP